MHACTVGLQFIMYSFYVKIGFWQLVNEKNDDDGSGGRKNDVTVCYVGSYFLETT